MPPSAYPRNFPLWLRSAPEGMYRLALAGMILVLIVIAYFPFHLDPPRMVRNQVARTAGGSLQFGEMNYARTPGTPAWLSSVRTSGMIEIRIDFNPQSPQQNSPASIMMLASDFWTTDFALEQDHSDLLIWLRRPGSDANGDPPFVVGGALQSRRWNSVDVTLQRDEIRIEVDGKSQLIHHLPAGFAKGWGPGVIALGDEVRGGRPWQGEIRRAQVRTSGYTVDYVTPGMLSIPRRFLYFPDHIEPFPPMGLDEWITLFLKLLFFIPIGFLIAWARRPVLRVSAATLLATALAAVLDAGKFLFHARHVAVADLVFQSAGALLGALLAWRLAKRTG